MSEPDNNYSPLPRPSKTPKGFNELQDSSERQSNKTPKKRAKPKASNSFQGRADHKRKKKKVVRGDRLEKKFQGEEKSFKFEVNPEVKPFLSRIGVPEPKELIPDEFQIKAVELIAQWDVIVTAPTGSGKTWIAKEAIERELSRGRRSWYASPLKALSNSKYLEFSKRFGSENVGLLTGDHKINTLAPIVVGTTEILRNQLYLTMAGQESLERDLLILDEAHYLSDPERGVVWEEVMIYAPSNIRFLLLSATVENADDLADWLGRNRSRRAKVVNGGERPVPLVSFCLKNTSLSLLSKEVKNKRSHNSNRFFYYNGFAHPDASLEHLEKLDLLPAIYFLKSRRDCDQAASHSKPLVSETQDRIRSRRLIIERYVAYHPYLENYAGLEKIISKGVAAHHAGHLPGYKMLVEELMTSNLLSAIFATSTVAAGVNFPARTVVLTDSDKFNGQAFEDLTATDLAQMTGRAGRRGLDHIGFAVFLPGSHMDLKLIEGLTNSPPNPVRSSLKINFTMVLNLLKSLESDQIPFLLAKSLSAWQNATYRTELGLEQASRKLKLSFEKSLRFLKESGYVDLNGRLTEDGELAAELRLEHPLVLHQAFINNGLPVNGELLAAVFSALLYSDYPLRSTIGPKKKKLASAPSLSSALDKFSNSIKPICQLLKVRNFPYPASLSIKAAKAVYSWALGADYLVCSEIFGRDPGDFVRLVSLVSEHISHLTRLELKPRVKRAAELAQELIRRPPVI
ncbi:MAG: DEAD/DEAH box helicase [Deltaproteobacteria bacterium]|jgi:superfamily II RNA helicase|nr:DEAD/DEAH box helicase [Deltaproteobacteria bacterium]